MPDFVEVTKIDLRGALAGTKGYRVDLMRATGKGRSLIVSRFTLTTFWMRPATLVEEVKREKYEEATDYAITYAGLYGIPAYYKGKGDKHEKLTP